MNPILRHRRMIMSKRIRHTRTVSLQYEGVINIRWQENRIDGYSTVLQTWLYSGSATIPYYKFTWRENGETVSSVNVAARDVISIDGIVPSGYVRSVGNGNYATAHYSVVPTNNGLTINWSDGYGASGYETELPTKIVNGWTSTGAPKIIMTYYID